MNQNNSLDNLLEQGHLQLERGQYEAGLEIFQQADSLFPNNSRVKYGLGISLCSLKEYQKALCCFDEASKIDPQDHLSFSKKGICLLNLGDFQSAINNYDMALLIEQNDFVVWYCKGLALYTLNQYKGALFCYEKAIKIHPEFQPAQECRQRLIEYREQASLQLSQRLLSCSKEKEDEILFENQELINTFFFGQIERAIDILAKTHFDNINIANKIQSINIKIKKYFEPKINENQIKFLQKSFLEIHQNISVERINSLFEINSYLLDSDCVASLDSFVNKTYKSLPSNYQKIFEHNIHQFITVIKDLPCGDRANNIDMAIAGSEALANIYLNKKPSLELASIYTNVGYFYRIRINGERDKNLRKAIEYCDKSLIIYDKNPGFLNSEIGLINFTTAKFNLGVAYQNITNGEEGDNLEKSIKYFKSTGAYTESQFPCEWANTQSQLGACYSKRIKGDRADNIEKAINYFQNSLRFFTKARFKRDYAETQYNLAKLYKIRIKGDKSDNIDLAIKHHIEALLFYNKIDYFQKNASINMQLGLDYLERIKGEKVDNIEQSIEKLSIAFDIYDTTNSTFELMSVQNLLATAYMERKKGDKADNLEKSIAYLENAIQFFAENHQNYLQQNTDLSEIFIEQIYGEILHNLSRSYFMRIKGSKVNNLEYALKHCQDAIKIRSKLESPEPYARTQLLLGCIYQEKIDGDISDNLELAIKHHKTALHIYKAHTHSENLSFIYNNLGFDYYKRIKGNKANNIELAIAYFEDALKLFSESYKSDYWAKVNINLGNAYGDRIKGNTADNLELAIEYYKNALQIHTEANYCFEWALIQNNLGNAYGKRIEGDKADNLEKAIVCLQNALKYRQKSKYQRFWAKTTGHLANIYYQRVKESKVSNLVQANEYLYEALSIFTPQDYPTECLRVCRSHGFLLFTDKNWQQSINIYTIAIEAVEKLREWSSNDFNKQETISNAIEVYQNIVQAYINLGQIEKAIEYAERGKARNLYELIATRDFYPRRDYTFQVQPISFEEIKKSLPNEQTVIIEWFVGNGTLSAFIVTSQQATPTHIFYAEEKLEALIDILKLYFGLYLQRDTQWRTTLAALLAQLACNLQIKVIIEQIKHLVPDCDRLILVPHRWLHLLPIHALPLYNGECLLDLFSQGVSYAPSVQLLELTQKQNKTQLTNLFAVQNPTEDLEFTDIEVQTIRSQFDPNDDVLVTKQAAKPALTRERLGQANLTHFSCHGYFNFENPELSALLMAGSKVDKEEREGEDKEEKNRFLPSRDGGKIDLKQCLTLGEIFSLDLRNCRLVTLSACETGLTDFTSLSDEYIGLPSGFLFAGSPSVVSSLWTVSDLSTTFLMIKFYQNLREIDSVAIALNQAQLWLRSLTRDEFRKWSKDLPLTGEQRFEIDGRFRQNIYPFASPYHWGAFCAIGS